jgi:hypothetical protein
MINIPFNFFLIRKTWRSVGFAITTGKSTLTAVAGEILCNLFFIEMLKKRIISLLKGRDKQVPPIHHDSEIKAHCPQAIRGERERRGKKKRGFLALL